MVYSWFLPLYLHSQPRSLSSRIVALALRRATFKGRGSCETYGSGNVNSLGRCGRCGGAHGDPAGWGISCPKNSWWTWWMDIHHH